MPQYTSALRSLFSTRPLPTSSSRFSAPASRLAQRTTATLRHYSAQIPPDEPALSKLPDLDPSQLTIEKTSSPKPLTPASELVFGRTFTDHMLSAEWTASSGWFAPRIIPYQNFSLDPATCVFHYAFTAFEGTKAYKDRQGNVRLFRPDKNMQRLNKSAKAIALPAFDGDRFIEMMKKFCALEERFIPKEKGYSLYLRPTLIGTQRTLGVGPPGSALLYMIASPVGPYYPTGFKAVSLSADSSKVRAWPGGVGDKKLGANYAPCVVPQMQAATKGYHQNLWLYRNPGDGEDYVTEVGTMNLFVAWKNKQGEKELITAPLDGTILEGVTRDSVLGLAKERLAPEGWKVTERHYTMKEVAEAGREGRLIEVFGAGTAVIVSPVRNIEWNGTIVDCGLPEGEEAGDLAKRMKDWIERIQYGEDEHPWSIKV